MSILYLDEYIDSQGYLKEHLTEGDFTEAVRGHTDDSGFIIFSESCETSDVHIEYNEDIQSLLAEGTMVHLDKDSAASPDKEKKLDKVADGEEEDDEDEKKAAKKKADSTYKVSDASMETEEASGSGQVTVGSSLPPQVLARFRWERAQEGGVINRNRRIYHEDDMPEAVREADELAKAGRLFLLGGHPTKGVNPTFKDIAGLGRAVEHNESTGKVALVGDILNTEVGRNAVKVALAGGSIPVSSRAKAMPTVQFHYKGKFGEYGVMPSERRRMEAAGEKVKIRPLLVLRKYKFLGWDTIPGMQSVRGAIAPPNSGRIARDRVSGESVQEQHEVTLDQPEKENLMPLSIKELKEKHAELYEQVVAEAKADDKTVSEAVEAAKKEVQEGFSVEKTQLVTEKDDLQSQVEELTERKTAFEEEIKILAEKLPEGVLAPVDPLLEAAQQRILESQEEIKALKLHNKQLAMRDLFEQKMEAHKYGHYRDIIGALVIGGDATHESEEELDMAIAYCSNLIESVLGRSRAVNMKDFQAPGRGHSKSINDEEAKQVEENKGNMLNDIIGGYDEEEALSGILKG